jgi:CMP-N-acetylneuraminic acid synthetase
MLINQQNNCWFIIGNKKKFQQFLTSPLRTAVDISEALLTLKNAKAPSCIYLVEAATSPYRAFFRLPNGRLQRFVEMDVPTRRQDTPVFYTANGAIYIAEIPWLKQARQFLTGETIGYVMPASRSLDIDTEFDLDLCEFLIGKYPRKLL